MDLVIVKILPLCLADGSDGRARVIDMGFFGTDSYGNHLRLADAVATISYWSIPQLLDPFLGGGEIHEWVHECLRGSLVGSSLVILWTRRRVKAWTQVK